MPATQKQKQVVGVDEAKSDQVKATELITRVLRIQANRLKLESETLNRVARLIEKLQQAPINYYRTCRYLLEMNSGSFC